MVATKNSEEAVQIVELRYDSIDVNLIGTAPLLMHRFSFKARQELLLPGKRKTKATLQAKLKHDPILEFRQALYRNRSDTEPALFHLPSAVFRQAIAAAAIDMPGDARKAQILRWIVLNEPQINLFGIPRLHMGMVRSSDMNKTPDVRSRPQFTEWACSLNVGYPAGKITTSSLLALIAGAGKLCGIGDWRPYKGGDYGRFRLAEDTKQDKAAFARIVKEQGRIAQVQAWTNPEVVDEDTEELLIWFNKECRERELSGEPDAYALDEAAE